MSRPLWFIKNCLIKEFDKWVAECQHTRKQACTGDVFEFLIQKGLLKGKHFNDYIDTLPELDFRQYVEMGSLQPLMEGYIPPRTWFGRKCKEKKAVAKTENNEKEELEVAAAAEINKDVPMTAEERSEKFPIIPTRMETKNGTWEIIGGYKKMDTLVGFRAKKQHEIGPFDQTAPSIVLTVKEWHTLCDELETIMASMIL